MKIKKKVQNEYFNAVLEGRKRFEVRLADFNCNQGDTLVLEEQMNNMSTGRKIECEILYKFNTRDMEKFHTKDEIDEHGLVVLAIRREYKHK